MKVDTKTLQKFLVAAKKNTWASGAEEEKRFGIKVLGPFVKEYKNCTLRYIDQYVGGEPFQGLEVVTITDQHSIEKPIWAMSYRGTYRGAAKEHLAVNDILHQALKAIPVDAPFRGPQILENKRYFYCNTWNGDVAWFNGSEFIGDKVNTNYVHSAEYWGGLV